VRRQIDSLPAFEARGLDVNRPISYRFHAFS
jgi:hypothetical protein